MEHVERASGRRHPAERQPQHTIVTSGPNWGGIDGLKKLKLLPDKNVIYSFHCYDPFTFTHQGATWSSAAVKPLRRRALSFEPRNRGTAAGGVGIRTASKKMVESYGKEHWNKEKLAARFRQGIAWGPEPCALVLRRVRRLSRPQQAGTPGQLVPRFRSGAGREPHRLGGMGLGRGFRPQSQNGERRARGGRRRRASSGAEDELSTKRRFADRARR